MLLYFYFLFAGMIVEIVAASDLEIWFWADVNVVVEFIYVQFGIGECSSFYFSHFESDRVIYFQINKTN